MTNTLHTHPSHEITRHSVLTTPNQSFLQHHASGSVADWVGLAREEMNAVQQIANATNGVVTPGNAATTAGTWLCLETNRRLLKEYKESGTLSAKTLLLAASAMLGEGLLDLADGKLATMTGTRSPLGKKADAGSDAVRISATVYTLARCGVLPRYATSILIAQKASTVLPSIAANLRGHEPTVMGSGKLTALQQRVCVGSFLLSAALQKLSYESMSNPDIQTRLCTAAKSSTAVANAALFGATITTIPAALAYTRYAVSPH